MAGKKIGLILALDGEKEFTQAVTNANKQANLFKTELKNLSKEFDGNANSMQALEAKQQALTQMQEAYRQKLNAANAGLEKAKENYNKQGDKLKELKKQLEDAKDAQKKMEEAGDTSSEAYQKQCEEVKRLTDAVDKQNTAQLRESGSVTDWNRRIAESRQQLKDANTALEQNSQYLEEARNSADQCAASIDEFGREVDNSADELEEASEAAINWKDKLANGVATKAVNLVADALGAVVDKTKEAAQYAAEVGTSFEAAMSSVEALSGASGSELDALTNKAKELGSSTKFTATEAAEALGNMALAGWDTQQMLNGIDGVLQLAAAGNMDLAAASDAVAGYLAAFNMEAEESSRLADVMAYAQAKSKTTTDQLAEAYSTAAVNMTSAGQAMETTTAILEGLASVNDTGSAAGTKLSAVMAQITAKMKDGKIAIGDTAVTVQDSEGNFRDLIDILVDIEAATDGMGDAQRSAALAATFNRTSLTGLNELLKVGTEQLKVYREGLESCDGAASDMAAVMQDNLQGKITILQSALEGLGISAYEKFSDPLQDSVEKITGVIEELTEKMNSGELGRAFEQLAESLGDSSDILLDVADGLAWIIEHGDAIIATLKGIGAGLVMYKAVTTITSVVNALQTMQTALKAAETAQIALNIAQMASPIGLVAAGVTALGVAFVSLANSKMKAARTEAEKTAGEIQELSGQVSDLNDALEEQKAAQEKETSATIAQYTAYQNMVKKVCDLNDALSSGELSEKKAAETKARMSYYVKQLNEQFPDLNLAIDEETGLLDKGRKAMDDYVESMKNKALASVVEEQLTELYRQQAEAQLAGAEAAEKQAEAQGAAADVTEKAINAAKAYDEMVALSNSGTYAGADAQEEYAKAIEDIAKKYGVTIEEMENGYNAVERATTEAAAYQVAAEEAGKAVEEAGEAEEEATKAIEEKSQMQANYLKELGYTTEQIAEMTGVVLENTDGMEENTEAAEDAAESMENLAETAVASADAQKEALDSLHEKYQEIRDSIAEAAAGKIDMFSAFDGGDESSLNKIEENLASQADGLEKWKANMEKLADEIGGTITPEFYQHLVELGPDAANAVNEMVEALDSEAGKGRVKKIAEEYGRALDASGAVGDSLAKTDAVIRMMMGEMSEATALDYSALEESLEGAAEAAASGGEAITEAEKNAFLEMVDAAREIGADIPEGLADGLASGEISIADGIAQLKGSIQGQYDFLAEMAVSAGIKIPENIQEGITQGGDAAVKAIQELQGLLIGKQEEAEKSYESSGKSSTEATAKGIESEKGAVVDSTGNVMQAAADKGNEYKGQFEGVGRNMMAGVALGMNENSSLVYNAVRTILNNAKNEANKATDSHSPSRIWRNQVGLYMAQGAALGILDGKKDVMSAAVDLAQAAIQGTQGELQINSPSKIFKQLGKYVSDGLGVGITNNKGTAVTASKKMAKEVYEASAEWMEEYKATHSVSLAEEKKFWKQLAQAVKKDSASYKEALENAAQYDKFQKEVQNKTQNSFGVDWYTTKNKKKVKKDAEDYYGEVIKAAEKYVKNKKAADDISLQQEKYIWQQVQKHTKKGTEAYQEAAQKIKELNQSIKEEQKTVTELADEAVANMENSIAEKKKYSSLTAAEENAMWDSLLAMAKAKGKKYYKAVRQQVKDAKKEIAAESMEYGVSGSGLEAYKSLYKVSAYAEWQYWEQVAKSAGLSEAQQLEVQQNLLEAKENYYEQMKELEDDYYDKCNEVNERLQDDVQELADAYTDALSERKSAIKDAFSTFDEFYSESEGPETLLANMQSQVAGYEVWMSQLEELEKRSMDGSRIISDEWLEELRDMGPEAAATIAALNMATDEQLAAMQEAYDAKNLLSQAQAEKELETLKRETEAQISALTVAAQAELNAYKAEYTAASAELSAAISAPLQSLAEQATTLGENATIKLIMGLKGQVESAETDVTLKGIKQTVADGLSGLKDDGTALGKQAINKLTAGMKKRAESDATAETLGEVQKAIKSGLSGLKSKGETLGGNMLDGILTSLNDTDKIKKSAAEFVTELEAAIKKEAGIASPSKRFRDVIGRQIPAGVEQGIEAGIPQAANAGMDMVNTMLEQSAEQVKRQQAALAECMAGAGINGNAAIAALNGLVASPIRQMTNVTVNNTGVAEMVGSMTAEIRALRGEISRMKIMLDKDTLVGELAEPIGDELAMQAIRL